MSIPRGEQQFMTVDYFASELLTKLDSTEPIFAAYEAQDLSRNVGFDFADFQDVVSRALDEIRETKEAYAEGPEGKEHYGDELADIMFSAVNLARHAGLTQLTPINTLEESTPKDTSEGFDSMATVDAIGDRIAATAKLQISNPDTFQSAVDELYAQAMQDVIRIARVEGFDPKTLLVENVRKYLIRCQAIEELAKQDGKTWKDLADGKEIVAYWKRAKSLLK